MDRELIERLAREAMQVPFIYGDQGPPFVFGHEGMRKFAALIAAECAKVAEDTYEGGCGGCDGDSGYDFYGERSAAAIRERFGPTLDEPAK